MADIVGERARLRAQGLKIVTREQWGARFDYTNDRPVNRPADSLFLHISVTDPADYPSAAAHMRAIEHIGISRFPSTGISYNAADFPEGLFEGQPLIRRGAHTVNEFQRSTCPVHGGSLRAASWNLNVTARALVLPQLVSTPVTDEQIDNAARWGAACIRAGEVKRGARWHGHRDVTAKSCPGDKAYKRIPELQRLTDLYVVNGLETDDMTPEESEKLAHVYYALTSVPTFDPNDGDARVALHAWCASVNAVLKQLVEKPGVAVDQATIDAIAKRVLDLAAERLKA